MLRLSKILLAGAAVMALSACGAAEVASPGEGDFGGGNGGGGTGPTPLPPGTPAADCPAGLADVGVVAAGTLRACQLPATITGPLTLAVRAGTIYTFSGVTNVGTDRGIEPTQPIAGSQQGILTIQPGVRIFAAGGADVLIVNRGSQIYAEGTATQPIVFTSRQSVEGTNTDASQGQWGGIILAGRAPHSFCVLSNAIGHTVGNHPADDGIEIFGGNVNLKHLVLTGADDDAFDTDLGWRGGAQFGIVTQRTVQVKTADGRGAGFEFSSAGTGTVGVDRYVSQAKISNFTLVGRQAASTDVHTVMHLDTGADATIINTVATSPTGSLTPCFAINDADTLAVAPTLTSVFMSCPTAYKTSVAPNSTTVFTAGANNTANGTSTLTAPAGAPLTGSLLTFINGTNENAAVVTPQKPVYDFFDNVSYIGAVQNSSDTWYQGWTCGLVAGSNCR